MWNLASLIKDAKGKEGFDEVIGLLESFSGEAEEYSDLETFLDSLLECSDDEVGKRLNSFLTFQKKYGYPYEKGKYGYPYGYPKVKDVKKADELQDFAQTFWYVTELEKIATMKPEEMKKALIPLIEKLKKQKYGYGYPSAKASEDFSEETINMFNQEICAIGDFGDKGALKENDLKEISKNWKELRDQIKPPLKLGHSEGFGQPAAGWVENIRIEDSKIVADFMDVPAKIADMIRAKHYRRVSPEIYMDFVDDEGKKWGKVLRAVALLGADVPEMKTLKDLEVLYNSEELSQINVITNFSKKEEGGVDMERLDRVEKKTDELIKENISLKIRKFLEENKERILPTMKPLVEALLTETAESEIMVTFAEGDSEIKLKVNTAIQQLIERLPKLVEIDEKGKESGNVEDVETKDYESIQKYADEHKVSFAEARRVLNIKA